MTNAALINTLHPEILAHIFLIAVGNYSSVSNIGDFQELPSIFDDMESPTDKARFKRTLTLSSVCQYWRNITINTGLLWAYFSVTLTSQSVQRSLDSTSSWLGRAGTTPLHVSIETDEYIETSFLATMLDSISLTSPLGGKKIRTLDLDLVATSCLNTILKNWLSNGASDTLTYARIIVRHSDDEGLLLQDWLPQCRELQVLCLCVATMDYHHFPSMPSIVDLDLYTNPVILTTTSLANILCACPSLQRLKLNEMGFEDTTDGNLVPVPLQHLEMLSLQFLDISFVLPLISSKSKSFRLSFILETFNKNIDLVDHIVQFSHRSTITALQLTVPGVTPYDLRRLLYSMPQLQTVFLRVARLGSSLALALRGADKPGSGEEVVISTFHVPHAIWLQQCEIDDEAVLRELVSIRPLQQLKMDNCYVHSSGLISEEKALFEFLRDSVPDLHIADYPGS
ncbi:hypothetical protein BDV93DRAFT_521044 [Ceratobasidium sp. AG-I]|nr:hypothetical protein BDV93DRAFT_521044 [Ceratobasidium sp. AG-I]